MKLTIQRKLLIVFIVLAVLGAGIVGLSYNVANQVKKTYSSLLNVQAEIRFNAKSIEASMSQQNSDLRGYLLTQDKEFITSLQQANQNMNQLIDRTLPLLTTEKEKQALMEIKEFSVPYKKNVDSVVQLTASRFDLAKKTAAVTVIPLGKEMGEKAVELAQKQEKRMQEEREKSDKSIAVAMGTTLVVSLVILALFLAIGFYIARSISRPIKQVSEAVQVVAGGDLTQSDIRIKNRDEVGELAASFNQMSHSLRTLIGEVGVSAEQVAASSEQLTASAEESTHTTTQISTAIQEVALGSENQLHGTEGSAAAMEEVTHGLQRITESSQRISEASLETAKLAEQGNHAIQQTVDQMNEIQHSVDYSVTKVRLLNERSVEIKKIIDVITDISSQTNLLALNAAIEAARAGEHGKGFAVVADEVRKLAEQSNASAVQIVELITDIERNLNETIEAMDLVNQNVEKGVNVAGESGQAFEKILYSVEEVTSQVQEATSISEQLSANSQEVNASVQSIAAIAKQVTSNSQSVASASEEQLASMEDVASSASSLSKMAEELQQTIRKFKV
ncbi:methyl-accepting chemotaxis protein [Aneurinibacillus sp. REN35]|uniref:methyl-accepting chemotaxis protein n=1 Tax=Aneurinibacillus sp. REN35 TaxID=3237286 RepID=UPI0035292CDB